MSRPPIESLFSSKILLLANLVTRSAVREHRRALGVAQVEWRIVAVLGSHSPLTVNEIALRLGRTKSQISRGVAELVRRNLVKRAASGKDGREVLVGIAAQGRKMHARLLSAANRRSRTLLDGFTAEERETLLKQLDRLIARARAELLEE